MLLQHVEFEVRPDHEDEFNEWYFPHVPHLLTVPGYRSGRRFVKVNGVGPKYMAVYEIAGDEYLSSALDEDVTKRHPRALLDHAGYERLAPHLVDHRNNIYTAVGETGPFFRGTPYYAVIRSNEGVVGDWEDAKRRIAALPDVLSQLHFRPSEDPAIQWLAGPSQHLVMIELTGEAAASDAGWLSTVLEDAPTHDLTTYRPIAWSAGFGHSAAGDSPNWR